MSILLWCSAYADVLRCFGYLQQNHPDCCPTCRFVYVCDHPTPSSPDWLDMRFNVILITRGSSAIFYSWRIQNQNTTAARMEKISNLLCGQTMCGTAVQLKFAQGLAAFQISKHCQPVNHRRPTCVQKQTSTTRKTSPSNKLRSTTRWGLMPDLIDVTNDTSHIHTL